MKRLGLIQPNVVILWRLDDQRVGRFPKTNISEMDAIGRRFLPLRLYSGKVEDFQCSKYFYLIGKEQFLPLHG